MPTVDNIKASLAAREAANLADPDISERHGREKGRARKLILAKLTQYSQEYLPLPEIKKFGKINDDCARYVRGRVVDLLRNAPLTHGMNAAMIFASTDDLGDRMKNCWHLMLGSGNRERTEQKLYRYSGKNASDLMKTYSGGGEKSATFDAASRPFYAALNYSFAAYGGSSGYGKTHLILKHVLRFNATFTFEDSFGVSSRHKDRSHKLLANYHNMYPIILNVKRGEQDKQGDAEHDVLKSMIDHALGLKQPPMEEFDGRQYVEAQIPGDILYGRDIEKVVIAKSEVPVGSTAYKNLLKFCKRHRLMYEVV
jgi:hypothetical protein